MAAPSVIAVAIALDIVQNGVDWSPRWGGKCPKCGKKKCEVTRTMKWEGKGRTRYHRCKCGFMFKSLELEKESPDDLN
jgi:DNA-directed RNA polymerase subunit M/transcription elongation factor TFIIS